MKTLPPDIDPSKLDAMIAMAIDASDEELAAEEEERAVVLASLKRSSRRRRREGASEPGCVPPTLTALRDTGWVFRMARRDPKRLATFLEKLSFDEQMMAGAGESLFSKEIRREFAARSRILYRLVERVSGDPLRVQARPVRPNRRAVRRGRRARRVARSVVARAGPDDGPPPEPPPRAPSVARGLS